MALFEQLAAKMIADLVRDYKLQAFQAAGFPGNAGEESGGFTKLQEQNPKSGRGGLGFFQDTGPRRVAFEAWLARNADKNWSAGDYAANYSFLVRELDGDERRVLAPLHSATTVEEAAEIVMRVFERPDLRTAHLEVRIDYARKALAAFEATGQDENELRAQPRPGATGITSVTPHAEVLHPLPAATQLAPIKSDLNLQQLLPMIMAVLSLVQKFRASKGESTDITQVILDIGQKMTAPVPPSAPAVPVSPKSESNPLSSLFSILLGAGTAGTMAAGTLGTPFGLGQDPTLTGSLMTIASFASPFIAMIPGGYGAPIAAGLKIVTSLANRFATKEPTK